MRDSVLILRLLQHRRGADCWLVISHSYLASLDRFYLLSPHTSYAGDYTWQGDAQSGCEQILKDTGIAKDEWQMGTTKAFIKNPETVSVSFVSFQKHRSLLTDPLISPHDFQLFALETMRDRYWHNMAGRIQRAWRNFIRYRNECATRIQRFWRRQKDGIEYARFRQTGHDLLGGRKERRRFSLVSYRRFSGDYLDVGGRSASGGVLKDAAGLSGQCPIPCWKNWGQKLSPVSFCSGSEKVIFSGRVELLKSSFGRSSKPSPRFLVIVRPPLCQCSKDRLSTTKCSCSFCCLLSF